MENGDWIWEKEENRFVLEVKFDRGQFFIFVMGQFIITNQN